MRVTNRRLAKHFHFCWGDSIICIMESRETRAIACSTKVCGLLCVSDILPLLESRNLVYNMPRSDPEYDGRPGPFSWANELISKLCPALTSLVLRLCTKHTGVERKRAVSTLLLEVQLKTRFSNVNATEMQNSAKKIFEYVTEDRNA